MSSRLLPSFVLLFLLGLGAGASAQEPTDDDRALALYQSGQLLYEQGRYEEAIVDWEQAYELSDRAKLLFNIANAYERMTEYDQALTYLARYSANAKPEDKASIDVRMRMLEEKRKNAEKPNPQPAPVPAPVVPLPNPEMPKTAKKVNGGGLVLVGVGVAAVGGGAALGLISRNARSKAEDTCVIAGDSLYCPEESLGLINQHRTTAILADGAFVVGAVAATAGIVMLATKKKSSDTQLMVGPNRVNVVGSFR